MDSYVYRGYTICVVRVPILPDHYNAHVVDQTGYEVWANGTYSVKWMAVDAAQYQVNTLANYVRPKTLAQPGGVMVILRCWVCGAEERVSDLDAVGCLRQTWTQDGGNWRHIVCKPIGKVRG